MLFCHKIVLKEKYQFKIVIVVWLAQGRPGAWCLVVMLKAVADISQEECQAAGPVRGCYTTCARCPRPRDPDTVFLPPAALLRA